MKNCRLALVLIGSLFLSACYEFSEELWIHADGSGRMKFTLGLSENLVDMMQANLESTDFCDSALIDKNQLETSELITAAAILKNNEAGMHYCTIDVSVTDFYRFGEVRNLAIDGVYDKYEFPFLVEKLDAGRVKITQEFNNLGRDDPRQSEFEKAGQEMAMMMMTPMLAGKYITVTVHAPKILSSNGQISDDLKTTTWKKPLIDLVRNPQQSHRFEMTLLSKMGLIDRIKSWWQSI